MPTLPFPCAAQPLTEAGYEAALSALGIDDSTLWAMLAVETLGCGFLADRRPQILYERHIFHGLTQGRFDGDPSGISNPQQGGYGAGGAHQYVRLGIAAALDQDAALQSASWGLGQVLGENFAGVGFLNVSAMVAAMCDSEDAQLGAVVAFILAHRLDTALQQQDWTAYATVYNGPDFAKNNYPGRLQHAFNHFADGGDLPDLDVRAAQTFLTYLGFNPQGIDGLLGGHTLTALHLCQTAQGLALTPGVDAGVVASLAAVLPPGPDLSLG